MAVATRGPSCCSNAGIAGEDFKLDRFGCVRQVADHVLQHLGKLHVELGLGLPDFGADVGDDLVDRAIAVDFKTDGEVAAVSFSDGGEAELEAGAAGGDLDLGCVMEDLLDVGEDAVGLGERGAGGVRLVEDEGALVHLR